MQKLMRTVVGLPKAVSVISKSGTSTAKSVSIADIARAAGRDPLDALLDLGLDENLDTGLIGRFFNAVDDGVEPRVKHKAGVIVLSDAGAHLMYLCDAGFGLYFLGHWALERWLPIGDGMPERSAGAG
jgi:N-acyl-D-amino-acid deacylase